MNKKQIKVKLGRLGVTDKDFKPTNWEKLYPLVNKVTSDEDVFLDIGNEGGFIMATFFSKKLSKSIVLTWDFSVDDIDDLAEEMESLIKEAEDMEKRLPDLSPCAYI